MAGLRTGEENKGASDVDSAGGRTGSPSRTTEAAPRSSTLMNPDVWFCKMDQVGGGAEFMEYGRQQPVSLATSELAEHQNLFEGDEIEVAEAADRPTNSPRANSSQAAAIEGLRSLGRQLPDDYRFSRTEANERG